MHSKATGTIDFMTLHFIITAIKMQKKILLSSGIDKYFWVTILFILRLDMDTVRCN